MIIVLIMMGLAVWVIVANVKKIGKDKIRDKATAERVRVYEATLSPEQLAEKKMKASILEQGRRDALSTPRCPKCGSTSITLQKQGFGVKKAVAGVVLTGGIGLFAGGINKNKNHRVCMNCGKKF